MAATRSWASCPSFTPSDSWPRCGCPPCNGVGVVYHPNPLDAQVIGELVEKYKVTFLVATPTFPAGLHAALHAGELRQPAIRAGRRGEAAGARRAGLRRHLRHSPARGLRLHRVLAGGDGEWRDFRAPGFRQVGARAARSAIRCPASPSRSSISTRASRSRREPPGMLLVKGPERDEGLSRQAGEDRRGAARRLVHHRRRRADGRGRLSHHHRPALALQQDWRRDGAAHQD
jgi:hypothetical protein